MYGIRGAFLVLGRDGEELCDVIDPRGVCRMLGGRKAEAYGQPGGAMKWTKEARRMDDWENDDDFYELPLQAGLRRVFHAQRFSETGSSGGNREECEPRCGGNRPEAWLSADDPGGMGGKARKRKSPPHGCSHVKDKGKRTA